MRITLLELIQTEQLQQPAGTADVLTRPQAKTGVLPSREMGEQGVVLEHHSHATALRRHPATIPRHKTLLQMHASA